MGRRDFRADHVLRGIAGKQKICAAAAAEKRSAIPKCAACGSCAAASSAMDSGACAMR
jgi:hypothetical protein